MKISLLKYIQCPSCRSSLELTAEQKGPHLEIKTGLLLCSRCGRWYPVQNFIPELYPDFLRPKEKELSILSSFKSRLSPETFKSLAEKTRSAFSDSPPSGEPGLNYKQSEMAIETKVEDDSFFGPGYLSPFNPGNPEYTQQLIRRFGNALPLLELKPGSVVADIGAGYAWTSEWLMKMGFTVIGVDICRTYLDIALKRMKTKTPHLILADVENFPLLSRSVDAVLCYDAFHHVHDREKAMAHFFRILKKGGSVVLAEPGPEHGDSESARAVMKKYGILEKGMSLEDLKRTCQGLGFEEPEEHVFIDLPSREKKKILTQKFIRSHRYADCHFYKIKKPG